MAGAGPTALLVQLLDRNSSWVDVGWLKHSGESTVFETANSYWQRPDRPVLSQLLEDRGPAWRPKATVSLPTWFSHLLPEGRLREAIADAVGIKVEREFQMLARIGADDLPGAIRALPREAELAEDVIGDTENERWAQPELGPLKFSLAGVQLKFSIFADAERGLTIPAKGLAGNWIAKLPDRRPGHESVIQNEFASLELARAAAIRVPEAKVVDVESIAGLPDWAVAGGGKALLVQRFDRTPNGGRVHAEQLAQVLGVSTGRWNFKYDTANFETVASVAGALCGESAVAEVIDRIVLNVLVGNGDAHTKNWAFIYPDTQNPQLSPAYDILPTFLYVANDDLGMKLNDSRSFADVGLGAFGRLASKVGLTAEFGRAQAGDAVNRVAEAWIVLEDAMTKEDFAQITRRRESLGLLKPQK